MCGRFTLRSSPNAIAEVFGLAETPHIEPHFNIAASQSVAVIREQPVYQRELVHLHLGANSVLGGRSFHRQSHGKCALRNCGHEAVFSAGLPTTTLFGGR